MWGQWVDGPCSESECRGKMSRARACNDPEPANGGMECATDEGGADDMVYCNTDKVFCPGIFVNVNSSF